MKVIAAYLGVILIWSTTPLGIQWSNSSLSFTEAVAVRMFVASIVCVFLLGLSRKKLIVARSDWKALIAGALGLFPNMVLVYWSAQFVPSGLIAVVLGIYPFLVGVFSFLILRDNPFTYSRVLALLIALAGLALVHWEQLQLGPQAALGIGGIVLSSVFFAASTVWLKRVGGGIEPLRQLTGALLLSTPFFIATWFFTDGELPTEIDLRSLTGVAYLIFAGSIAGGLAFYYVLNHCKVATVALIPLMTPVLALLVGYVVEGETLSRGAMIGSGLIVFSVAVYQGMFLRCMTLLKRFPARQASKLAEGVQRGGALIAARRP